MVKIIILGIWFALSMYAVYYYDRHYYSKYFFKISIGMILLALMINAWQVYDPSLNHMIGTVEINPSWNSALILAFVEGISVMGPIAGILILREKIKERRE
ncbi:MAG: hypothetical protein J6Y02_15340 [Pseudobutyrivibrio sp.]|nr:hypothetical protein [Pseudobutyrivibrio sp.]